VKAFQIVSDNCFFLLIEKMTYEVRTPVSVCSCILKGGPWPLQWFNIL